MDENKFNPEWEETEEEIAEDQPQEIAEDAVEPEAETEEAAAEETPEGEETAKKEEKPKKEKKPKKLRNQAFLRRGSFSAVITAVVIAGIIVLNVLAGALAKRIPMEIDMTPEKKHSISAENIEYLKKVDSEVSVTVCADKDNYVSYVSYYYGGSMTSDISEYLEQTLTLLEKYPTYNNKIRVQFIDPQGSEFNKIAQQYSSESLGYGSIIVSAEKDGKESHKVLNFTDIYQVEEDSTYAAYGMSSYEMQGNNLETALTSAIAYVSGGKSKKVAFLTGHSKEDLTDSYRKLLTSNSYDVSVVEDSILKSVSSEYDAVVIAAPTVDFMETEINAISDFLSNNGNLNKSLIYFADASAKYLPNLSDFLAQWGIDVEEGILFETNDEYHLQDDPTTMLMTLAEDQTDLGGGAQACVIGASVPLLQGKAAESGVETKVLVQTTETVVAAPVGVAGNWDGAGDYKKQTYCGALMAEKSDYNDENESIKSTVIAFSSTDFFNSQFNSYQSVANENVVLSCSELAVGAEETGISFTSKTITTDSFAQPTESKVKNMKRIFMFLIPILVLAAGIVVYVRRRNAQ